MITSDAITWDAPDGDHPARRASQRSYSAGARANLEEWLTVYAESERARSSRPNGRNDDADEESERTATATSTLPSVRRR